MIDNTLARRDMSNIDYDPAWPLAFEVLQQFLSSFLGNLLVTIEHVGSTAVPGLSAKPIIDLDLVIARPEQLPVLIKRLAELGYTHQGDLGRPGREAFTRNGNAHVPLDSAGTVWYRHHLYVCLQSSPVLQEHLLFRNYLRTHPETLAEYAQLKQWLAERFLTDPEKYVAGKTAFVQKVLDLTQQNAARDAGGERVSAEP